MSAKHFAPLGHAAPPMDAIRYESEVYAIALTFGLSADRVVASLTGREQCTPLEFVEAFRDGLDRDNDRAFEDWQHAAAEIRAIYAGML